LNFIGYDVNKIEHAEAKKGRGAFYGHKEDAKEMSNRRRRADDKRAVNTSADDSRQDKAGLVPTKESC